MNRTDQILQDSNQAGIGFLLIELNTALTFLSVAETTRNLETARRNRDNARTAYQSVLRYQGRVQFGDDEKSSFEDRLAEVKRALAAAGLSV